LSTSISERVDRGELAIVGATYRLAEGRVEPLAHLGDIDE
ncbi:MAG: carbonic anhydrase, partial [Mycobacteriaceae bacterium]|nr:carbonic anhydrase [Mycobacteriaceae bacterium]